MGVLSDERKRRHLDWLLTKPRDRQPSTQKAHADELGVSPRTLRDWEADPEFIGVWEHEAIAVAGGPERTQQLLDKLFNVGMGEDRDRVAAAKQFFAIAQSIRPPAPKADAPSARGMTDAEIEAAIQRLDPRFTPLKAVQ